MKKKILFFTLLSCCLSINANAAVLGEVSGGFTNDMGAYSVFHKTEFESESVGKQTEYYVEYTPNTDAVPIVANDGSLWGQSDMNTAVSAVQDGRVIAGINGDYFSFKTGLPMGAAISGGRILSKDSTSQDAIGFRSDGTAFIDELQIITTAVSGAKSVEVECINKWYQSGFDTMFLLTDDFGKTSHTNGECIFVIASPADDAPNLKIGSDAKIRVDEKFVYNGDIEIPARKFVLVLDNVYGKKELLDFMNSLNIGDEITISNTAVSEKNLWDTAAEAMSSIGGRLLKNSEIGSGFEAGAAPRTAVGIKADGNVIMYTLDGRQSDYSYGAQLTTLAQRMLELGCVDAINLDGGGSTTMGALLGGEENFEIMNRPSDGYLRSVANFIFLKDNRKPTGEAWIINTSPINSVYYLGDILNINIESAYDTNNYKMDEPPLNIEAENAEKNSDGSISFNTVGNSVIRLSSGKFSKEIPITVHRLYFYDIDGHWAKDKIEAVSDNEIINGISEEGRTYFKPDNQMTRSEFAAIISRFAKLDFSEYENIDLPFADKDDIQEWAIPVVKAVYGSQIMSGKSDDGGATLIFDPESPVTRAEAMTMLNRLLQIEEYSEIAFADNDDIPDWAFDGVTRLVSAKIVTGYNDNTIRPNNQITRAEGTAMLFNCLNK